MTDEKCYKRKETLSIGTNIVQYPGLMYKVTIIIFAFLSFTREFSASLITIYFLGYLFLLFYNKTKRLGILNHNNIHNYFITFSVVQIVFIMYFINFYDFDKMFCLKMNFL